MWTDDGLGTRTPISFGAAIERARGFHLRDFTSEAPVANDRYLLHRLTRQISRYWYGWILIQAARRAGRITVELGMAMHPRYPLHNGMVRPSFGVDGVRERLSGLDGQEDVWFEYRSQEQLMRLLQDVTQKAASRGVNYMYERHSASLVRESKRAQDALNRWEALDATHSDRPLGARFPDLEHEARAYDYCSHALRQITMRPVLGELSTIINDKRRLSALVYVMSYLLENSDETEMSQNIYTPAVIDDEGMTLCGRAAFYVYLDPAETFDDRVNRYCFFKALDMIEAQYEASDRLDLATGVRTRLQDME